MRHTKIKRIGIYGAVGGIIAALLMSSLIPLAAGLTQNINPNARTVTWGTEPLGWNTAWLTTDDDQFYKVYREAVGAGVDYEAFDPTEYDVITGSLDFGGLSDLATYNDVYMGFYPLESGGSEQNSFDNASAITVFYGSETSGTYADTYDDDDTVHTIQETDEGSPGSNVENNVDNNNSNEGAPSDVGTENNFVNAQSDPTGIYMDVTEADLGTAATNTENNVDNNGSDVDGSADKGTENNFANAQSDPTGTYMDITEADQAGGGGSEWLNVNGNTSQYIAWTYTGSQPYLDAQDQPTNIISTTVSAALSGYYTFTDTGLSGSGISVNFSVYIWNDDGPADDDGILWWGHNGTYYSSGNLGATTTPQYLTYSIPGGETFTAAEINNMQCYFEMFKSKGADDVYIDHVRIGTSQTGGGPDYELDFEYQWTTLNPLDDTNEELCIYVQATFPTENLLVKIRDSSSWVQVDILDGTGWHNVSITGYLDAATETIQLLGADEAGEGTQDTWNIGYIGIHTWTAADPDYELDFEYQWTTLNPLDDTNEELCIYIQATYPTEHLDIDIWTGSWTNIATTSGTGWINTSITAYLDNAQETIRIVDVDKASENVGDTWNIGYIGIHTWTAPTNDYQLSVFYTINIPDETLDAYYVNMSCSRTSGGDNFDLLADALSLGTISDTAETYFTLDVTSQISDNLLYLSINDTIADDATAQSISIDWLRVWGYTAGSLDYDLEVIFGFDSGNPEAEILNIEIGDESNVTTGGSIAAQIENHTQTSWHTIFIVDSVTETGHYWNSSDGNTPGDLLNSTSGFRLRYYYQNAGSQYNLTIDRMNATITYQIYEYRIQVLLNFTFSPNFDAIQSFNVSDRSLIGAGSVAATIYNFTSAGWDSLYSVTEQAETAHEKIAGATGDYISGGDLITIRYLGAQVAGDYGNLTFDLVEIDIEYTVSDDTDPPTITLDAPVNNTWSYVNRINFTIADASGVDQAYYITGSNSADLNDWVLLPSPHDIDIYEWDEGVYELWVIANDTVGNPTNIFNNQEHYTIIKGDLMPPINILEELFYSLELWGYLGPVALIIAGYFIARRDRTMGVLWFCVICIITAGYIERFYSISEAYGWHIIILILGGLFVCIYPLFDR